MMLTIAIVLTGCVYLRGWFAIRKTRPAQFTLLRLNCFLLGLGVLGVAVASPLDGFADVLLSAHMVQHLLLMSVVPPLLLLGWPVVPLLRGLPPWILRPVLGPLLRLAVLRRLGRWVTSPLVGWMAMNLTFLGWHVPAALAGPGANPFHVSPLSDQMLGAVIMWVVGSFVFLVPATWITFKLLTAF